MTNPFASQPPRLNRTDRPALWLTISLFVGIVLIANGLIFSLGWNTNTDPVRRSTTYTGSGALVGTVWITLFLGMAVARWRLNGPALRDERAENARWWLGVLVVSCLLYSAYSLATNSMYGGLVGNVVTILLAGWIAKRIWPHDQLSALLVGLVVGWVLFATYIIFGELGWLGR